MVLGAVMPAGFSFHMFRDLCGIWKNEGDIHYIGGADVLPPPLEAAQENEMILDLNSEDSKNAKEVLIYGRVCITYFVFCYFRRISWCSINSCI